METTYVVETIRVNSGSIARSGNMASIFSNQIVIEPDPEVQTIYDIEKKSNKSIWWSFPIPTINDAIVFDKINYPIFIRNKEYAQILINKIEEDPCLDLLYKSGLISINCHAYIDPPPVSEDDNWLFDRPARYKCFDLEVEWDQYLSYRELGNAIHFAKRNNSSISYSHRNHTAHFYHVVPPHALEIFWKNADYYIPSFLYAERNLQSRSMLGRRILNLTVPALMESTEHLSRSSKAINLSRIDLPFSALPDIERAKDYYLKSLKQMIQIRDTFEEERMYFVRYLSKLAATVRWELPEEEWEKDVESLADEQAQLYFKWSTKLNKLARRMEIPLRWIKLGIAVATLDLKTGVETSQSLITHQSKEIGAQARAFAFIDSLDDKLRSPAIG